MVIKGRAGDETRTRDIFLGKEVLYQLSYTRETGRKYEKARFRCQSPSTSKDGWLSKASAFSSAWDVRMLFPVKSNGIWISAAIAVLIAMFMLNPAAEKHRTAFMQSAEARFFDLSPEYQQIFQQVRSETLRGKDPEQLRYGNFLLFSILKHADASKAMTGHGAKTRLLTVGVLGFVLPVGF